MFKTLNWIRHSAWLSGAWYMERGETEWTRSSIMSLGRKIAGTAKLEKKSEKSINKNAFCQFFFKPIVVLTENLF